MGFYRYFKEEVKVIRDRDPAIHSDWEVLLYSSFWAVYWYRKAHWLYKRKHFFLARLLSQHAARRTGIEIHPGAEIGEGFFIDHGSGVIIGETTVIGKNVTLFQGVTLGGTGKEQGKRHPTIGDNVMVSAGAKVLGSFKIGSNSKIGAGSVVLKEVPENSTVVGVPGRVVKQKGMHIPSTELNQIDLPDPVKDDLTQLKHADSEITNHMIELEQKVRELTHALNELKKEKEHEDL